ncbi:MAG TPA: hypothetical protein VK149_11460 [Sideroxyarcus sp.]|nr:hypothetical protein [Sideroxyarcus sp.]
MRSSPTPVEINSLFDNQDPDVAWEKAVDIVRRINPSYDFALVRSVYEDVLRLFRGEHQDYARIQTLYHDLSHTLSAFLSGVRLMHGVHISGDRLDDSELTMIMVAILMHDVGYAQRRGEEAGTGAQYTQTHVQRGIAFMRQYFSERKIPLDMDAMAVMILGTEHPRPFAEIEFHSERTRLLASIVATADITGQMADRIYLEKLLFLYLEFREARFGNYRDMYDMLRQTDRFYQTTRDKLDGPLGGVYRKFAFHFGETMGISRNFYLEAIDKNIAYLERIIALGETACFGELKRKGIVEKARSLA